MHLSGTTGFDRVNFLAVSPLLVDVSTIFSFYKIKTIGDLSAMAVNKVKQFGLKGPVLTVTNALEEYTSEESVSRTLRRVLFTSVCSRQQ